MAQALQEKFGGWGMMSEGSRYEGYGDDSYSTSSSAICVGGMGTIRSGKMQGFGSDDINQGGLSVWVEWAL